MGKSDYKLIRIERYCSEIRFVFFDNTKQSRYKLQRRRPLFNKAFGVFFGINRISVRHTALKRTEKKVVRAHEPVKTRYFNKKSATKNMLYLKLFCFICKNLFFPFSFHLSPLYFSFRGCIIYND